jgi:sugar lactone lactonase YvrE
LLDNSACHEEAAFAGFFCANLCQFNVREDGGVMLRSISRWGVLAPALLLAGCGSDAEEGAGCPDSPGVICTWAGSGELGFNGDGLARTESDLYWPVGITFTEADEAYVLDWQNHRVRRVTSDGTFETVIGTGFVGDGPAEDPSDPETYSDLVAPGAPGTKIDLNHPTALVPQADGTLLLVAWHNHKIRQYDPNSGLVLVTCGRGAGFAGDGGPASSALLNQPNQLAITHDGTQYILDQRNQVIREISADGVIRTVAGTPAKPGFSGDGGLPTAAQFSFPTGSNPPPAGGLALDASGNLYVADGSNHRIRKIDFENAEITTLAGTGEAGYSGDGGPANEAALNNPRTLAVGPDGRLYVADEHNHRIRAIDLEVGTITTVAGTGDESFSGDGGPATEAALNRPAGIAFDSHGALYIADTYNSRIRRVGPQN